MQVWPAFIGGLLGSAHCIGMCGGFALAIGATRPALRSTLANQLVYSAGRLSTYALLGCAAGSLGVVLQRWKGSMVVVQQTLSILAGVTMLAVGVGVLTGWKLNRMWRRPSTACPTPGTLETAFKSFLNARGRWSFFLAGVFTGFLPCGLVYAFVALAAAAADPLGGMILMIAFGAGTVPAMTAIGCGGAVGSRITRARIHRVAAAFVVLLGLATTARALPFIPCDWLHFGRHTTATSCKCSHDP